MTSTRFWQALPVVALTALLFAVLWRWIEWRTLTSYLRAESLPRVAAAAAFFALMNVTRGVRIARLTTRYVGVPVSVRAGVGLATITNLGNHVLPLRLGELLYVTLCRSVFRVPLARAAGVLLSIRVYDLVGLVLLALLGLYETPELARHVSVPAFLGLTALLLVVAIRLDLMLGLTAKMLPGRIAHAWRDALPFSKQPRFLASSLGYALVVWSMQAVAFAFLLPTLGVDVGVGPMVVATSIANLAAVLPLSALGTFGAMEAGWAAGFVAMGVPATLAVTSGLAAHLIMVVLNAAMSAPFIPYLLRRDDESRNAQARAAEN